VLVGLMLVMGGLAFTAFTGATPAYAASPADGKAYIVNAYVDTVSIFDTTTNTVVTTVPVGSFPYDLAVTPDGTRVYVANGGSSDVSVIDTATNTVMATVPVGAFPDDVAVTPDGTRVYVPNGSDNNVSVIETATNTVVATVLVGSGPVNVAITRDGTRAYVSNTASGDVSVINTVTNTVVATAPGTPNGGDLVVTPDGTRVYLQSGASLAVIDTATNTVVTTFSAAGVRLALTPDGTRLYGTNGDDHTDVIDTATNTVVATIPGGNGAFGVAVSPDGTRAYVGNTGDYSVLVIDTATNTVATNTGQSSVDSPFGIAMIPPAPPTNVTPPSGPTTFSVSDLSVNEGNAGTTAATFTVTRSGNASGPSTVKYKTSGGTATAGTDYSGPVPLTDLSFASGETSKPVTVGVTGDNLPEKDETFNLALSAPTGAVIADATATATIVNDDGEADLAVDSVTVPEGNAGTTAATFTITRSGTTTGTSTATYRTNGGTAAAGTDYTPIAPTIVTFNPGETTKTVAVDVAGDLTAENNETFNLVLSLPSVGTVLADASGVGTIVDDEGPVTAGPATFVSVNNLSVAEGASGTTAATFTVTRSGTTTGASSVKVKTGGGTATAGTDYTAVPLTVVNFAAGDTSQPVTVNVAGDNLPEKDETFNLMLSVPTGATIADGSATATIRNDDGSAYLTVGNVSVNEGNTGTTTATFTLTRSGNTNGSSTLKYKTTDGTAKATDDYSAVGLTPVTFAAGETTKTVSVDVTGDTAVEKNETFNLVLSASVGATLSDASGAATIVNDDTV
jgi:YVTN family beta-propeller protein